MIEGRFGDWGGETVLVDGRPVSQRSLAGWIGSGSHFFEIVDEHGRSRHVDVRFEAPSLGIGRTRLAISVDGIERARLDPVSDSRQAQMCLNCGYALVGLPVENGEVRCPECGRHSNATMLGLDSQSRSPRSEKHE